MTNLHSGMRFLRHDLTLLLTLVASVLVAQPTLQLDWQTPVANADGASQLELRTSKPMPAVPISPAIGPPRMGCACTCATT